MTPIIQVENLTHVYSAGTPMEMKALDGISFEVRQGEYLGIIGPTGSGKSTFIQHLNGLIRPSAGRILFHGEDIFATKEKTREVRFKVGLVFQYPEYQLFEETVYKDIAFGPENMKLSPQEVDERVREAAGFVGLPDSLLEKSPFALSGGQKRRVAIAGVIAMRPEVLVLDEPAAGLDPAGCREIAENIDRYHKAMGATVIMVTHSMEDAARHADRMLVLHHGKMEMLGTPREVFSQSSRLRAIGLEIPAVTAVALRLQEMGVELNASVYTVEQAVDAIVEAKARCRHA